MENNVVIYPHQLFEKNMIINKNSLVFIVEHPYFFTKYKFNINKLVYHRATLKFYYDYIKTSLEYKKIAYINCEDYEKEKVKLYKLQIKIYDPIEKELIEELQMYKNVEIYNSPMFLTSLKELKEYNDKSNSYIMNNFYVWQRKRLNLFVTEDMKPYYGKWSFDEDNRKKFPDNFKESINKFDNKYIRSACKYFKTTINELHSWLPVTFDEINIFFEKFIEKKLKKFGDYEDGISQHILIGNHSALSSIINIGMLVPQKIISRLKKLEKGKNFKTYFNSVEGFTRQIIGWREYMRYVYIFEYKNLVTNVLNHKRRIKNFDKIVTEIPIVDDTLKKVYQNGWTHHIERLMILGNYFMLCEVNPHDVYRFFYEKVCLDAYDWVMVGNVYGMSQFASKVKICTKPYFCSSNYLLKMSDYKKGDWCYILDCLFYRFIGTHYDLLKSNYSTAIMAKLYDKNKNKKEMIKLANEYLKKYFK
jgi:deoxyribodipyrimidine photolyase-related protein